MNNKPKRYRLLKDTLWGSGVFIKAGTVFTADTEHAMCWEDSRLIWYSLDAILSNIGEWFEEIKEPDKIAVKHFGVMDDYPIKNRYNYTVCTSGEIPRHLFIIIEKAVERIINSPIFENEDDIKGYLERSQSAKYTQEELDKAIVDAFKAAGLSFSRMGEKFDSAEDYLKSLKK